MGELRSNQIVRISTKEFRDARDVAHKYFRKWVSGGFGLRNNLVMFKENFQFSLDGRDRWKFLNSGLFLNSTEENELHSMCRDMVDSLKKYGINKIRLSPTIFADQSFTKPTCLDFVVKYPSGDVLLDLGFSMGNTIVSLPYGNDRLGGLEIPSEEIISRLGDLYYGASEAAGMVDSLYHIGLDGMGYAVVMGTSLSNGGMNLHGGHITGLFRRIKYEIPSMVDMYLYLPDPKRWVYQKFNVIWGRNGFSGGSTVYIYPTVRVWKSTERGYLR